MFKLIFVESTFQLQLANQIKGEKKIYYLEKGFYLRFINTPKIIFLILRNKNIYIYDHRNITLILAIIISALVKKKIYVADEGFHTLLVDKFKSKYLFRETNFVKKIFLWLFQKNILKTKRFKQIDYHFKKKVSFSNYKTAVFIDQSDFEITLEDEIKEIESKYDSFEFAKHPRGKIFNNFNYSNNSLDNLIHSEIKKDFYGVYSTALIYALKNNHNVYLIKIDPETQNISDMELDYINDIQDILIDLGAVYEL